jgi:hypothetical protein
LKQEITLKDTAREFARPILFLHTTEQKLTKPGAEHHPRNFSKFFHMILAYNKGSPPPENSTA